MAFARVALLLLLLLGHQRWGAVAEEHNVKHSVSPSVLHYAHSDLLLHHDTTEGKLGKVTDNQGKVNTSTDTNKPSCSLKDSECDPAASNSSPADFPCPDAAAIAPCLCSVDASNFINLDCTEVESEEQLAAVFQQDFPVKQLHGFYMDHNDAIKVLGDILNGVTFEEIRLQPGPFALQAVAESFLLDSRHTLRFIEIYKSNLLSDWFPFATLIAMEALDILIIYDSNFTTIPKLYSPTISFLSLNVGPIDAIEPGTFDDVPRLEVLELQQQLFGELKAGTIPIREGEMVFYLSVNDYLQIIEPGTFFFSDANSANSNQRISIYLNDNQLHSLEAGTIPLRDAPSVLYLSNNRITSIEPGTFVLPEATGSFSLKLWLHNNRLTTFDEAVFGDLMPFITELQLYGNPLKCECDIAWLVLNPAYMSAIDELATCDDGTLLQDLDPQDFENFCRNATLGDH